MSKITFVTALIRPQNLIALQESIYTNRKPGIAINWMVVVDGKGVPSLSAVPDVDAYVLYAQSPHNSYGFLEKNQILDLIQEDSWVYFLDDDTSLHPNFYNLFEATLAEKPDAKGMVFAQVLPDKTVRTVKPDLEHYTGKIDMTQFVVKRSAIAYHRFFATFGADGEFFSRIYRENKSHFVFKDEVGCFHNNLRTDEKWDPQIGYGRPY
ncbi:MAG: hypothetical protein KDD42_04665 [Bdellovibrionales bacterium]|nr:hypothetical protein [Bdellovibrionales bacterium]